MGKWVSFFLFNEAIPHSFNFDENLRLWVVAFDVAAGVMDEKRIDFPAHFSDWVNH